MIHSTLILIIVYLVQDDSIGIVFPPSSLIELETMYLGHRSIPTFRFCFRVTVVLFQNYVKIMLVAGSK